MSKRKTEDQIDAEISALVAVRSKVRERTAFGDDNHAAIDAQLAVLCDRLTLAEVHDSYGDEDCDEFDQHTFDAALDAYEWMTGAQTIDGDAPSASWASAQA